MLIISFKLSLWLGFVNIESKTNKLQTVHKLHCTLFTVHYQPYEKELSKAETSQGRRPMWKKTILLLGSRVFLTSTLGELASMFKTYIFKNYK